MSHKCNYGGANCKEVCIACTFALDNCNFGVSKAAEPTTAMSRRRRARGRYPKTQDGAAPKREKRIPEYLEADEVNAIIRAAPSPKAKLLMLQQWRAGLRVSEALDLEVRDLSLDTASPTLRVRSGKGGKTRLLAGASGATRGAEQRSGLRGHRPGQNRRGSPHDRMALGEDGGETG